MENRRLSPLLLLVCLAVFFLLKPSVGSAGRPFIVYAFIPWERHMEKGKPVNSNLADYLEKQGIHPIRVIYDFMTHDRPDPEKIRAIAIRALEKPDIPVSFDTEFGDRRKPETVIPGVTEILRLFREYNRHTLVGVYATAPQNTYAWNPGISHYDSLNARYRPVAALVDFLSPVLYNYNGDNTDLWKKAAIYNLDAAQKYGTGKPVYPYISPVFDIEKNETGKPRRFIQLLDEKAMRDRLQTLYDLGASGCIIWASSQSRTADGQKPVFDSDKGWGKAVIAFINSLNPHSRPASKKRVGGERG
jgi:hypothetical protein